MICKRIMLGATMLAAIGLAAPAFAAGNASPAQQPGMAGTAGNTATPGTMPSDTSPSMKPAKASTVPLSTLSDAKSKIISASVEDSSGAQVGTVKSVKTSTSGKTSEVDVTLSGATDNGKVVRIKASKLRYEESGNLLTTTLTKSEIDKLPIESSSTPSAM